MIYVEFYGENNPEQLLPSMIRRVIDTDNPEGVVSGFTVMTRHELDLYNEAHRQTWDEFMATYEPPSGSLWDAILGWKGL